MNRRNFFLCFVLALSICWSGLSQPAEKPVPSEWLALQLPFSTTVDGNGKLFATSHDGKLVGIATENGIYASADSGKTFSWTNAPVSDWSSIVSDSSGENMYALDSNAHIWSSKGNLITGWEMFHVTRHTHYFYDLTINSNAQYLYAVTGTCYVYRFQNSKNDLITVIPEFLSTTCGKIMTDSTGAHIVVQGMSDTETYIAVSNDYGVSFTIHNLPIDQITDGNTKFITFSALSFGKSNQYLYIPIQTSPTTLFISSNNGGETFSPTPSWLSSDITDAVNIMIVCSSDGQYVLYGGNFAFPSSTSTVNKLQIFFSDDYGKTFNLVMSLEDNLLSGMSISSFGDMIYILTNEALYSFHGKIFCWFKFINIELIFFLHPFRFFGFLKSPPSNNSN